MTNPSTCSVPDCDGRVFGLGLCNKHYLRQRRHGSVDAVKKAPAGAHRDFLEAALAQETDECILWPSEWSTVNGYGYASLQGGRDMKLAHVHVLEVTEGPRPHGKQAAHSCGVCLCVNKRHLRWATPQENEADKRGHGTDPGGERNGMALLSDAVVREIRALYASGTVTQVALAEMYGITQGQISRLVTGKRRGPRG